MTAAPSIDLERQTQPAPAHSTGSDTRGSGQCNTGGGSVDDGSTLDGSSEADIPGTSSSTDSHTRGGRQCKLCHCAGLSRKTHMVGGTATPAAVAVSMTAASSMARVRGRHNRHQFLNQQRHTWRQAVQAVPPCRPVKRHTQHLLAPPTTPHVAAGKATSTGGGSVDDGSTVDGSRKADTTGTSSSTDRDTHDGRECNNDDGSVADGSILDGFQ